MTVNMCFMANEAQTVKFRGHNEDTPVITQQDTAIASLKILISGLNKQVEALTSRTNDYALAARKAVANQNRMSALVSLRSKKLAESTLKERSQVLAQLEDVYAKIEQAVDQVDIVRVMEAGAGVLRNLNAEAGGIQRVEDVVQDLREEMSKANEIGSVLNEVTEGSNSIDENAVDDELDAMEREEQQEKEKREAERTRERLEGIKDTENTQNTAPRLHQHQGQEAQSAQSAEKGVRMSTEAGAGAMDTMSIDDTEVATKERSHSPRQAEHMPTAVFDG